VESATRISGLSVPFDIDEGLALRCLRASNGTGIAVSDQEIYEAPRLLLMKEGNYSAPFETR